jgi:hypothetical protein
MNDLGVVFALCLSLAAAGAPVQTTWKAGVAQAVITPNESIWLAGYGDRTRPSEGVLHDILIVEKVARLVAHTAGRESGPTPVH